MKKIFYSILFSVFLLIGCQTQIFTPMLLPDAKTGIVNVAVTGANAPFIVKTALPSIDASLIQYEVVATNGSGESVTSAEKTNGMFQLLLTPGEWTVNVTGYYMVTINTGGAMGSRRVAVSKGTSLVTVASGGQYSVVVATYMITDEPGTGSFALKVKKPGGNFSVNFFLDGNTILGEESGDYYIVSGDVSTGTHDLSLEYKLFGVLVYRTHQAVYIAKDLTTDHWTKDSEYSFIVDDGINNYFYLSQDFLMRLLEKTFYVHQEGQPGGAGHLPAGNDTTGTGSFLKPFSTINKAFTAIDSLIVNNISTGPFTIYIDETVSNLDSGSAMTFWTNHNIKIAGYTAGAKIDGSVYTEINAPDTSAFISVNGGTLTLEDIEISGWYSNNCAIDYGSGVLNVSGKVNVTGNKKVLVGSPPTAVDSNIKIADENTIQVIGPITGSHINCTTATTPDSTNGYKIQLTTGFSSYYLTTANDIASKIFFSDQEYTVGTVSSEAVIAVSAGSIAISFPAQTRNFVLSTNSSRGNYNTNVDWVDEGESKTLYLWYYTTSTVNLLTTSSNKCTSCNVELYSHGTKVGTNYFEFKETTASKQLIFKNTLIAGSYEIRISVGYDGATYNEIKKFTVRSHSAEVLSERPQGTMGENYVVKVSTEEGLRKVSDWSNQETSMVYVDVVLQNDIYLTGEWTPIGNVNSISNVTIDGNGKTVYGMNATNPLVTDNAFIGKAGNGVKIKNLTVEGQSTKAGILASYAGGVVRIENCVSRVNVNCTSTSSNAGGILADPNTARSMTIINCKNYGNITSDNTNSAKGVAGVVGYPYGSVYNCENYGTVTGKINVGGIVGRIYCSNVYNCINYGKIVSDGSGGVPEGSGGGIVGESSSGCQIKNCVNLGELEFTNTTRAGHIAGGTDAISECYYIQDGKTLTDSGISSVSSITKSGNAYIVNNPLVSGKTDLVESLNAKLGSNYRSWGYDASNSYRPYLIAE